MPFHKRIPLLLPLLLATPLVKAQTPTGTISGVVTDRSGSLVAGATVSITETSTNVTHTVVSDSEGRYTEPFVQPGTYSVHVESAGFRPATKTDLHVEVASNSKANFALEIGQTTDQVVVSASAETLDTDTSNLSATIPARLILDLPDNGRNPFDFAALAPTVSTLGSASTPHIGGSRNGNNEQLIDGMTNILPENNVGNNLSAYTPIIDSVQEVNVQSSVLEAEYGRFSGGIISLITKGGGNQFHGTAFEFLTNEGLDARAFGSAANSPKVANHRYQSGGTLSGPLHKDKTFFFVDFESNRQASATTITSSVPQNLSSFLKGDFSSLSTTIYDPNTVHYDSASKSYIRSPFAGNKIDPSRLNPIALKVLSYYPAPQTTAVLNNYVQTGSNTNNFYHFDSRVDQEWNKKFHSFVRFSHFAGSNTYAQDYGDSNPASPGGYNGPSTGTAYSLSFNNTVTFSPKLLGEFRYGFSKSTTVRTAASQGFDPTTLGFTGDVKAQASLNALLFPHFSFSDGYSDLGTLGYVPLQENPLAHDVNGSLLKILGGHSIKVGGEFRYLNLDFYQFTYPAGNYAVDRSWTQLSPQTNDGTGNAFASFLLGLPSSGQITNDPHTLQTSQYLALYAEDDWKATSKLTLNYGLRWDVEFPRTEKNNQLSVWDPNATSPLGSVTPAAGVTCPSCGALKGAMRVLGTGDAPPYGNKQVATQWKDFAPRLGFSFNPIPRLVVRGGFGIVFQPSAVQAAGTSGSPGIEGFVASTSFQPTFNNQQSAPVATLSNPFPSGYQTPPAASATCRASTTCLASIDLGNGIDQSYFDSVRNPYTEQYNLAVQFQFPGKIKAEVAYLGNRGLFLIDGDPGRPHDQLPTSYASLGSALLNTVANPFYGKITTPGTALSQPTITANQLLRQYPQYNGVNSFRKPEATSEYDAFTLRLDREFGNGLTFTTAYTGSKAFDNSASSVTYLGPAGATYANQYNPQAERSLSPFDISRIFVASTVYELPFGRGHMYLSQVNRLTNVFIGGWQTDGVFTYSNGTPFLVPSYDNGTTQSALLTFAQRPSIVGNPVGPNHTLNGSAFVRPAPYTIGNAPRVISGVRNPSGNNLDFSAIKNTRFGDSSRYNVQFRLEMFNALNHLNRGNVSTTSNGVTALAVQTNSNAFANVARTIQLGFKFYF